MKRLKSIDNFRGISIIMMIWLHLTDWWLTGEARTFVYVPVIVLQYGWLVSYQFMSGASRYLFFKTGGSLIESSETINNRTIKREFVVKGLFLLVIAFLYNIIVAFSTSRPSEIWSWFALLAIAFSILLVTPLLNTSRKTRGFLGVAFLVINFTTLALLQDFQGQSNVLGFIYHFLFYPNGLHPILSSFAVFLIGTVVGDAIYEIYYKEEKQDRLRILKKKLIFPSILIGGIILTFVLLANSFLFLNLPSLYGIISTIGVSLILFSLLVLIEEYEIIKTKKNYKFIFYFSYYSLTIYLAHNLLYFLFFEMLDALTSLLYIAIVIVLMGLFLKLIYPKLGASISIKKIISKLSHKLIMKLEEPKVSD